MHLVDEGLLWGEREVAIPNDAVKHVFGDGVHLSLTSKEETWNGAARPGVPPAVVTSIPPNAVTVYWRPGCPWCASLRRGLRRAAIPTTEVNIWEDLEAAATVRDVAGGNETVPTVMVGDTALVNPSVADVRKALAAAGVVVQTRPRRSRPRLSLPRRRRSRVDARSSPRRRAGGAAMRAVWNETVLAESHDTVVVEGNHYFPPESVNWDHLEPSDSHTTCPWKGEASYYSVVVDGERNPDAAWVYREPKPAASEIAGRLAFWHGVRVEGSD